MHGGHQNNAYAFKHGLSSGGPSICKHNARTVGFKKLICCQESLHKRGFGGSQPPQLQTHCSHGEWGGVQKDSYYSWRVSITTHRVSSKLAQGFRQKGDRGRRNSPHLQTQCAPGWFHNKSHMVSSKLARRGCWGAAAPPFANTLLAW